MTQGGFMQAGKTLPTERNPARQFYQSIVRRGARFALGAALTVGVAACTRIQHAAAAPVGAIADSITGTERKGSGPARTDVSEVVNDLQNGGYVIERSGLPISDPALSEHLPAFEAAYRGAMVRSATNAQNISLAPNEIGIANFSFGPSTLTVKSGTKVVFINNDEIPHLIASTQNKFKQSTLLDTNQRFTITLTKPGTYDYYCSLHPAMQGKIIVQPPS
jgi:plastocyanin